MSNIETHKLNIRTSCQPTHLFTIAEDWTQYDLYAV